MSTRAPYPFEMEGTTLCRVLDDPGLWTRAVDQPHIRQLAKDALKRAGLARRPLAVDDEPAMGAALVRLMSSPKGRRAFAKVWNRAGGNWPAGLASGVYLAADDRLRRTLEEEICDRTSEDKVFLSISKLAGWLESGRWRSYEPRDLAHLFAAFAILQVNEAGEIRRRLLAAGDVCGGWLDGAATADDPSDPTEGHTEETESRPEDADEPPASAAVAEGSLPSASNKPTSRPSPRGLAARLQVDSWDDIGPESYRAYLEELEAVARRHRERLTDYEDAERRVDEMTHRVTRIAGLAHLAIPSRPGGTIGDRAAALLRVETAGERILEAATRIEVLCERLGRPLPEYTDARVRDFEVAAATLTAVADELAAAHDARQRRIAIVDRLLHEFAEFDGPRARERVAELDADALALLVEATTWNTTEDSPRGRLASDERLLPLLFAQLWHVDDGRALAVLDQLAGPYASRATSALDVERIESVVGVYPERAGDLAQQVFVGALAPERRDDVFRLDALLDGAMSPHCRTFYDAVIRQSRRQAGDLRGWLRPNTSDAQIESARLDLLELIDRPPQMQKLFHRMRVYARETFFKPLRQLVQDAKADAAIEQWATFGSLDDMVAACAEGCRTPGSRIEDKHRAKTLDYLAPFDRALRRWHAAASLHEPTRNDVADALHALERAGSTDDAAATLATAISRALEGPPTSTVADAIRWGAEPVVVRWHGLIGPTWTASWPPALAEDAVPMSVFLADILRQVACGGESSLRDAVDEYLALSEFDVAVRAAEADSAESARVMEHLEQLRQRFRERHDETVRAASEARPHDRDIDDAVQGFDRAVFALDFSDAALWAEMLVDLLAVYRRRTDPARRSLVALLEAVGERVTDAESAEDLTARLERLRERESARRVHLAALDRSAQENLLPNAMREALRSTARAIDVPALWPPSETIAGRAAVAVDGVRRFLVGQARRRADDPSMVDLVLSAFDTWWPLRLRELAATWADDDPLYFVAEIIAEYAPAMTILKAIGQTPAVVANAAPLTERRPVETWAVGAIPARPAPPTATLADLVDEARRLVDRFLVEESTTGRPDFTQLRRHLHERHWSDAREVAAALIRRQPRPRDRLSGAETAYLYALGRGLPEAPEAAALARLACLAAAPGFHSRDGAEYRPLFEVVELLARALGADPGGGDPPVEVLATALERLRSSDADIHPFRSLFEDASQALDGVRPGSAWLAEQIWSKLGAKRDARASLLFLLFRSHRTEALEHLAMAGPVPNVLLHAVRVHVAAETDPTRHPLALQLASAFRQQAAKKPNARPWTQLFAWLDASYAPSVEALRVSVVEEESERLSDGSLDLAVHLEPSPADPVETLRLFVGGSECPIDDLDEGALLENRMVHLRFDRDRMMQYGEQVDLPYRFVGRTLKGEAIEQRGTWSLKPRRSDGVAPISELELLEMWPGADGRPVSEGDGFHGRDREMKRVDALIRGIGTQRSAMIFGQRRIGKTSMLLSLVQRYPPGRGRAVGAFVDVSGLEAGGSLKEPLLKLILAQLDTGKHNQQLRDELHRQAGPGLKFEHLGRNLNPGVSLALALEELSKRIDEATKGTISRLALFIDEFDRFVEPLLSGQRAAVEKLMWDLRQVVQQSSRVALFLAGSGLGRLFSEEYGAPMFGSLDQIEVGPFRWEEEQDAIYRTFLPDRIRDRLVSRDALESLVRRAVHLSGGHPYYLAMLGLSAAWQSRGYRLVRSRLDGVVDAMISGKLEDSHRDMKADRFYGPIFESLQRLKRREQNIAKVVLVQLAQRTTPQLPMLRRQEALDWPDLTNVTEKQERDEALQHLHREGAVVYERSDQVRLAIPMTAAALRFRAAELMAEALRELRAE